MAREPKAPPAYLPAPWTDADVAALQALQRGDATAEQQQRALRWVVDVAAATYDMAYRPGGQDGERETCFAEGRRFVGNQIVKLLRLNLNQLRKASHG